MWRPSLTIFRKIIVPSMKENVKLSKLLYSTKSRLPRSTAKLTLISASVGILVGAGYGGYTHYKINSKKSIAPTEVEDHAFLKEPPKYLAQHKVLFKIYILGLYVNISKDFV